MNVKHILVAAILGYSGFAFAPPVRADASADARKAIQAGYAQADAAAAKKDIPGVFAHLAPDFVEIGRNGKKIPLAASKQQMAQMFAAVQDVKMRSILLKVNVKGDTAIATTKEHGEFVTLNPQTQQPARILIDTISEDTWVKTAKGWLGKSSKLLSENTTLNGKRVKGLM